LHNFLNASRKGSANVALDGVLISSYLQQFGCNLQLKVIARIYVNFVETVFCFFYWYRE